jgi:DNA polymerase III subunit alpha
VMESLVYAGAFDSYEEMHRAQFFAPSDKHETYIEHLTKWAGAMQTQADSTQNSLFGAMADSVAVAKPQIPRVEKWPLISKLEKEKEVTGIYLSGHPLDDYRLEIDSFTTSTLANLPNLQGKSEKVKVAGFVTNADHRISQKGTGWGRFILQDYAGQIEVTLFSEDYQKFKFLLEPGSAVFIQGSWEKRWNSEEWNFKLQEVKQLASIGEQMAQSISIKIPIDVITNDLIDKIDELCKIHKGKHDFKIQLIDFTNKNAMSFLSGKRKVNAADNDLVLGLEKLGIEWKLN